MYYQEKEREVSLRSLLVAVLRQWRRMIVFALLLGIAAGGVMGFRQWRRVADQSQSAAADQAYAAALEEYEQTKVIMEENRDSLKAALDRQQDYLDVSVLMNLDPWNFFSAKASFYIVTEDPDYPDTTGLGESKVSAVAAAYMELLWDSAFLSEVAREKGLDLRCLKELIDMEQTAEGMLRITVRYSDVSSAESILKELLQQMAEGEDRICEAVAFHRVEQVLYAVGPDMDPALAGKQSLEQDSLKAASEAVALAEDALKKLQAPQMATTGKASPVSVAVKYGVLGAVAGVALTAVTVCFAFLFGDKVYSPEELQARFDVEILGAIPSGRRKGMMDIWLDRMEGRFFCSEEVTAAHIQIRLVTSGPLLVVGKEPRERLVEMIAVRTGRNVICCTSLLEDVGVVEQLKDCGGVVLAIRCGSSRYKQVGRELAYAAHAGVPVLGCVVEEI